MGIKSFIKYGYLKAGSIIYGNDESKVIYYHDVHDKKRYTEMSTTMELFKKHIEIIKERGYSIVSDIEHREKELEITFDDGFRGIYENFDFFTSNKIPVRVFLVSGFIGKKEYLTKHEISELLATGLFKIGSHTVSHENLDDMSPQRVEVELQASRKNLEDMFGKSVKTLCFPRGKFTDKIIELAKESGYEKLYCCLPGSYFKPYKKGLINRSLVQNSNLKEFKLILNGADIIFFNRYLKQHYNNKALTN